MFLKSWDGPERRSRIGPSSWLSSTEISAKLVRTTLKTDAQGRVALGALADITSVTATGPEGTSHTWNLPLDHFTYRQLMHAPAGEVITLPYLGTAGKPSHEELALFEVRGDVIRADRFAALSIRNGLMELKGLAPGDYDLWLKHPRRADPDSGRGRPGGGPLCAGPVA